MPANGEQWFIAASPPENFPPIKAAGNLKFKLLSESTAAVYGILVKNDEKG